MLPVFMGFACCPWCEVTAATDQLMTSVIIGPREMHALPSGLTCISPGRSEVEYNPIDLEYNPNDLEFNPNDLKYDNNDLEYNPIDL